MRVSPYAIRSPRPRGRRWAARSLLLMATVLVLGGGPVPTARASCVGPVLVLGTDVPDVQPTTTTTMPVSRGDSITVSGEWFHDGCDDTGSGLGGCAPSTSADPETPKRDVDLILRQGSASWVLGTSDAGPSEASYSISWSEDLPKDVEPGPATLSAAGAELKIVISS